MALMLTLIFLLLASREGLLNRFVDVLLGNVSGHGIPIRVSHNVLSKGGVNAIDTSVLSEIRSLGDIQSRQREQGIPGLGIYPYRSLEASLYPPVTLPAANIWNNLREGDSKIGPDFDGWAVNPDDPLWEASVAAPSANFPLEIIVNHTLFTKYFNYDMYRAALEGKIPSSLYEKLPETLNKSSRHPLNEIWLQLNMGFRQELFPFKISWVKRFPVLDKISFVFPLTTYHALKAAHDFPELRFYPEEDGQGGSRIKQILLESAQQSGENNLERFAAILHGQMQRHRGDVLITFEFPIRQRWLDMYAEEYTFHYDVMESISGDRISNTPEALLLPCGRLPDDVLRSVNFRECIDSSEAPVPLNITSRGRGFRHALVYVPDRIFLSKAVDMLTHIQQGTLSIHPSYQDALNRFGFLSSMLDAMEKPYSWFMIIFSFALLGIQIGTLVGHRRRSYGVLLAKGMEWWQFYCMLCFQVFMALMLGLSVAMGLLSGARLFLEAAIAVVADEYSQTLSIVDLNLLPIGFAEYCLASLSVLFICWILAAFMLYFMPIRRHTHPASLLH